MKDSYYTDEDGRKWAVKLPEGLPEDQAYMGIPVGPPSLASLNLPVELEVRLHNQLFDRRIFTFRDIKRNPDSVVSALQRAFKVDVQNIIALYNSIGAEQPPQVLESPAEE